MVNASERNYQFLFSDYLFHHHLLAVDDIYASLHILPFNALTVKVVYCFHAVVRLSLYALYAVGIVCRAIDLQFHRFSCGSEEQVFVRIVCNVFLESSGKLHRCLTVVYFDFSLAVLVDA